MLTGQDDHLHPPASADRWWSETCWFSFDQPGRDLSATIYPLFRPNLGICSLGVSLWDASAHEPWAVPYHRTYWHLAMPATDLVDLRLEGLRYERLEPLQRYRVSYHDADDVAIELEVVGLREPHEAGVADGVGHLDQPCHVVGEVRLRGDVIPIDTLGMRDRTWSVRAEDRHGRGSAYSYGNRNAEEQLLVMTTLAGNEGTFSSGVFTGYLVRDGVAAALVDAARRVVERRHGYPVRIELEAEDSLHRRVELDGHARNRLANQATASQFAWMTMVEWSGRGETWLGEDQEVWSPDMVGPRLAALDR